MRGLFSAVLAGALALAACGGATERGRPHATGGAWAGGSSGGPSGAGAPADGSCGCLDLEIAWWIEGGVGSHEAEARLTPCDSFRYQRRGEPSCETRLADCSEPFGLDELGSALASPDVTKALEQAPVVYGRDSRDIGGQVDHIEIGGKVIEVGDECDAASPCDIPRGVSELDHLLGRLMAGQRAACIPP